MYIEVVFYHVEAFGDLLESTLFHWPLFILPQSLSGLPYSRQDPTKTASALEQ